jgi:uncharacterized membrane protein YagU involved in acid resistance
MEKISAAELPEKSGAWQAILFGGLLAGILDLTAAFINSGLNGVSPLRVMQAIASGLLGAESFAGGTATAALGVFLHFVIAFGATIVFYLVSRKLKFLTEQAVASGVIYGILVYLFMSFIVLPLSSFTGKTPSAPLPITIGLIIHILFVGLPIVLTVRRFANW